MNRNRPFRGKGFKRPQLIGSNKNPVFKQVLRLQASNFGKTSTCKKQELKNLNPLSCSLPLRWIDDGDIRLSGLDDLDSFIKSSEDMSGIRLQLTKN